MQTTNEPISLSVRCSYFFSSCLKILAVACVLGNVWGSQVLQIVNDNDAAGFTDTDLQILFVGNPANVTSANLTATSGLRDLSKPGATLSLPLSKLSKNGTLTSDLTGKKRTIYEANIVQLSSGVIYISKGNLSYNGTTAPSISASSVPFQTAEMTSVSGQQTNSDLTFIDNFALPLQLDVLETNNKIIQTKSCYYNFETIFSNLQKAGAPMNDGKSMLIGPGQVYSLNKVTGNFTSFEAYLQSLVGKTLQINGTESFGTPNPLLAYGVTCGGNYTGNFTYNATLSSTKTKDNFTYDLTPSGNMTITGAPSYFPKVKDIEKLVVPLNKSSLNKTIYGAVLDSSSFNIVTKVGTPSLTPPTMSGPFYATSNSSTKNKISCAAFSNFDSSALNACASSLRIIVYNGISKSSIGNATISSVSNSTITLAGNLTRPPVKGDKFEVLFQVTNSSSKTQFTSTALQILNYTPVNNGYRIVFQSGNQKGYGGNVTAMDSTGKVTLNNSTLTASPQAGDLFFVSVNEKDVATQLYTNSIFSYPVADLLAALNFGFLGSPSSGNSSSDWFGYNGSNPPFPQKFPFAAAQPLKPYYNSWASIIYNSSDAYGFAFSDRVSPSPLITNNRTETMRLTILPRNQLNAPNIKSLSTTNSSITLGWVPETNANMTYTINIVPNVDSKGQIIKPIRVLGKNGTCTINNLKSGMPYQIHAMASNGTMNSKILPVYTSTSGIPEAPKGTISFQFSFTPTTPVPQDSEVKINNKTSNSTTAGVQYFSVNATTGTNYYVLDVQNKTTKNSVYKTFIQVEFDSQKKYKSCSMEGNEQNLSPAGSGSSLVIGIPFQPEPRKNY